MLKDVLFLSTNFFNPYLPLRKFWFSKYFSENGFRVVYVEFPHTYLAYLKKGFKLENRSKLERISDNYFVLKSFPVLPFFKKYKIINWIDNKLFYRFIKESLKEIGFNPSLVWVYLPFFPEALSYFNAKKVYDCVDDYTSLPGLINPNYVLELERKTVNLVDKVIVTNNPHLEERVRSFGKEPIVISNGVNYKLFSGWLEKKNGFEIKKRIIYVGNVSLWFDFELVSKIADSFKDYEVMIVGFASVDLSPFKKYSNINFAGKLTQEQFVPLLSESSVAIIPFKINTLTKGADPLKVYEYLAAGVPVVSTPVGNVSKLPIYVANTHKEFIKKIKEAIESDSIEKRREHSEKAKSFSWETRYKMIQEILDKLQ